MRFQRGGPGGAGQSFTIGQSSQFHRPPDVCFVSNPISSTLRETLCARCDMNCTTCSTACQHLSAPYSSKKRVTSVIVDLSLSVFELAINAIGRARPAGWFVLK